MPRNAPAFEIRREDLVDDKMPAGSYYFMHAWRDGVQTDEKIGWIHGCPCGCGGKSAMWFEGYENAGGPKWMVTGEWPKVSMTPSIGIAKDHSTGQFHWHGYLRNGVFEEC